MWGIWLAGANVAQPVLLCAYSVNLARSQVIFTPFAPLFSVFCGVPSNFRQLLEFGLAFILP